MSPDSVSVNLKEWFSLSNDLLKLLGGGGIIGLLTLFFTKTVPWLRTKWNNRSLEKRFGAELYPRGVIERATKYYIEPFSQSVDPSGGEESRLVFGTREKLFSAIDHILYDPTEYRYLILLADSGMGKTSFLLNYYVRNLRRFRRKLKLELLPLGIPDVDQRLRKIRDKKEKVLFLDALDEDTLAIVDHVERLRLLMQLTRDFQKIVITCRTQFFPKDEEIPQETGIVKIGPKPAGEEGQYFFHKLYLTPFTDNQVKAYLRRRYPLWQWFTRRKATNLVHKIDHLSARPMLLAHIKDLLKNNARTFHYAFELYEEMIEAWLVREEGILEGIERQPLREFSECLAVNLFVNRQQRGAERVPIAELQEIASAAQIPLETWKLTGRSLLNRDAAGNYKFAHRSIMEYLFVKRFLEMKPAERPRCYWTDQVYKFFEEIIEYRERNHLELPDFHNIDSSKYQKYRLRQKLQSIDREKVKAMLVKNDFYDRDYNKNGKGISHRYYVSTGSEKLIYDLTTGLVWQQGGSADSLVFKDAEGYIKQLNQAKFAGFRDWRLPTLEEAMSLMEPKKNAAGLYVDARFDPTQRRIWTNDPVSGGSDRWVVDFYVGSCFNWNLIDFDLFVRAVRLGQSSTG